MEEKKRKIEEKETESAGGRSSRNGRVNIRRLTVAAMLSAVAVVLQFLEIPIPLVPSFIKLDFSDLPEIIGAFLCGPGTGVFIAFLKNLIHLAVSQSGFVGELSNFVLGAAFAFTAGIIYKRKKSFASAVVAGIAAALVMAVVSVPLNYFAVYPLYYTVMGFPKEAVLQMYQLIRPSTGSILEALIVFNMPFTAIKGLICSGVTLAVYKPIVASARRLFGEKI